MPLFSNPHNIIMMNRGADPGDGIRVRAIPDDDIPEEKVKISPGYVSTIHVCQTTEAAKLCIYDACSKIKDNGDYNIGGTYTDTEPDFWFYFTTTLCHGNNYLLNLFVNHRNAGNVSIQVSNSNEVVQKCVVDDDVPHLVLPNTLTTGVTLKSTKPNQNYYLKTFCFSNEIFSFNAASTLIIPIKINTNPKFVLDLNIIKSIKLQHDLSGLLTKQEKSDFVLESATHKQFPTHKILLAAHSPVLRNMIKNAKLTSLFIDISDNDMELLLEFMYTGTIKNVMKQDCLKLLEIADKFQLKPLFMLTQHVIGDQINISNAVEMAVIAKKYNLEELLYKVFDFIIKKPEVLNSDAWNNLKDVELTKYMLKYNVQSMNA